MHALRLRDYCRAVAILGGWLLSWTALCVLLIVFLMQGCEFDALPNTSLIERELMVSWSYAVFQRFAIAEPFLIFAVRTCL